MWRAATLFVVVWLLYLRTLAPTITWEHEGADAGDLITAAYTLGIPHPTGYPLYVLCAKLFTLLPVGTIAYRVNLMSATFAAATVALLHLIVLKSLTQKDEKAEASRPSWTALPAAMTAGLAFAFSPLFWSQAVIAEVYTLNAFFVTLITFLLLRYLDTSDRVSRIWLLCLVGLAFGLATAHHLTILLMTPAALFLWWHRRRRHPHGMGVWFLAALSFLAGLSFYWYLPLRAAQHPPINWGDPHTLSSFVWVVTGQLFRGYVFSLPWHYVPERLAAGAALLTRQFGPWGLLLGLVGLGSCLRRARVVGVFSVVFFVCNCAFAIGYDTADSSVYLIPTFLMFALWLGHGVDFVLNAIERHLHVNRQLQCSFGRVVGTVALGLILLSPLTSLTGNFASMDLSGDRIAREYGTNVLSRLPTNAIIITLADRHTFTLWYFRYVEHLRPDVAVINARMLEYDWYRETVRRSDPGIDQNGTARVDKSESVVVQWVRTNITSRPIYVTEADPELQQQFTLRREGAIYRLFR